MVAVAYVDTSAFIKLHDEREPGAGEVREYVEDFRIASSVLLYAEAMSAVARKRREDELDDEETEELRGRIRRGYRGAAKVQLTRGVLRETERLLFAHPLRAGDAVHVASALILGRTVDEEVRLLTGDNRMAQAASSEALTAVNVLRDDDGRTL